MVKKREIRESAMQLLFAHDLHGELRDSDRAAFWELHSAAPDLRECAEAMAADILAHLSEIDEAIAGAVQNYSFDRLNTVDRNILRLGAYELIHRREVPKPVVIDEAIEIARRFATEDSGKFVNGVLDRIARSVAAKNSSQASDEPRLNEG